MLDLVGVPLPGTRRLDLRARAGGGLSVDEPARTDCDAGAVFGALSDPTRRALLAAIAAQPAATATELAAELPISRQAVLKHLNALTDAGLLDRSAQGARSATGSRRRRCPRRSLDGRGRRPVGRAAGGARGRLGTALRSGPRLPTRPG